MNDLSNDDLARRLRPVRSVTGQEVDAAAKRSQARAHATGPDALMEQDVHALFQALQRGTQQRLGRAPTAEELRRLVAAIAAARLLVARASSTVAREMDVYWTGSDWAFEPRAKGRTRSAA